MLNQINRRIYLRVQPELRKKVITVNRHVIPISLMIIEVNCKRVTLSEDMTICEKIQYDVLRIFIGRMCFIMITEVKLTNFHLSQYFKF